jgi:uncharacterized protein YndB with AHSA1/START domain
MTLRIETFEPRVGGRFRMAFVYSGPDHRVPGKSSAHEDLVEGTFQELVPGRRVVERVRFQSDDPAFAEPMTVVTEVEPVPGGTRVVLRIENVPEAIRPEDHAEGMAATLAQLAAFVEGCYDQREN